MISFFFFLGGGRGVTLSASGGPVKGRLPYTITSSSLKWTYFLYGSCLTNCFLKLSFIAYSCVFFLLVILDFHKGGGRLLSLKFAYWRQWAPPSQWREHIWGSNPCNSFSSKKRKRKLVSCSYLFAWEEDHTQHNVLYVYLLLFIHLTGLHLNLLAHLIRFP